MIKLLTVVFLFLFNTRVNYCSVNNIYFNEYKEGIELDFDIDCDYTNKHKIEVIVLVYEDDNYYHRFINSKEFISNRNLKANLNINKREYSYFTLDVYVDGNLIFNDIRFDLGKKNNCIISNKENTCNERYKQVYDGRRVYKEYLDLNILNENKYTYLNDNSLDMRHFSLHSKYDFSEANIYLLLEGNIDGYWESYNNQYEFLLSHSYSDEIINFSLLDNYYVNLLDFNYKENYDKDYLEVNKIYFPFNKELKVYKAYLVVEDFITIRIEYSFVCDGKLLGECADSKYCVRRGYR